MSKHPWRRGGQILLLGLVPFGSAHAAERPNYGGEAIAYVFGGPITLGLGLPESLAEASLASAVYEPLYAVSSEGQAVGVLAAGPPVLTGDQLSIPLKEDVILHDGTELNAERAIAALLRPGGPLGSLLFIAGARQRAETGVGAVGLRAEGASTIVCTLIAPYPELALLLAEPGAELVIPSGDHSIGSGPFAIDALAPERARLIPHLQHRDGRPFLDALELRRHVSRSGVLSLLRRGEATVVFGTVGPSPGVLEGAPELLVLDASRRPFSELDALAHHDLLDAALPRERLAARFLGASARPASRLDGRLGPPEKPPLAKKVPSAALRVPKDAAIAHRFLERLQLDLLRGGVSVTIDRSEGPGLPALALGWIPIGTGDSDVQRLHGLLRIAAGRKRLDLVPEPELIAFARATPTDRSGILERLEHSLRRGTALVPIALRHTEVAVRPDLEQVGVDHAGSIRFDEARFSELP